MAIETTAIKAFSDNYIWLVINFEEKIALCVDPGDASPVLNVLEQQQLRLTDILITHHHFDHTGGIKGLKQRFPEATVYGPKDARIPPIEHFLEQDQQLTINAFSLKFDIISTPGHTSQHLCYYDPQGSLFCGDTLFSAGCGRLFEGNPAQMLRSLKKLQHLPAPTRVYCAHEYTLNNLAFAQSLEPDNHQIKEYTQVVQQRLTSKGISLPSTIGDELNINPFLRTQSPALRQLAEAHYGRMVNEVEIFSLIRELKDNF